MKYDDVLILDFLFCVRGMILLKREKRWGSAPHFLKGIDVFESCKTEWKNDGKDVNSFLSLRFHIFAKISCFPF